MNQARNEMSYSTTEAQILVNTSQLRIRLKGKSE
jgi:hypothetical protein